MALKLIPAYGHTGEVSYSHMLLDTSIFMRMDL